MNFLYLTILFPLLGFLLLSCFSRNSWSEHFIASIGIASTGLATLITLLLVTYFFSASNEETIVYTQMLWHWIHIGNFQLSIKLNLDGLSLIMLSVVTCVGLLIQIYSSWYMSGNKDFSRFFAYTNLFIASMLVLILADNLLLMYLGWEGVGFCSYLLIGFYYTKTKNGIAAIKAFITTRIGDILLIFAIFMLYDQLGSLNFNDLKDLAMQKLKDNSSIITWITLLLLGGAVGKSAQLPLQTWLADAMAGPTPVSALIHAATMVTAGVYLIIRTHSLFIMAPDVLNIVGIVGTITLLLSSFVALVQTDIKRILAYSTMSQIGYMFLALGVQAWDAAIFHMIAHAFFKALLFLSSGSIIIACYNEQNIFNMGGLRKHIPFIYICFLVGGAALSALPLITVGFYSKDQILLEAFNSGHNALTIVGLLGTLITSIYTFRMVFIIFHGELKIQVRYINNIKCNLPLLILLILSTFVSTWIMPSIGKILPIIKLNHNYDYKLALEIISSILSIIGIVIASFLWLDHRLLIKTMSTSLFGRLLIFCFYYAWGFDWFYDKLIVKPYLSIARLLAHDPLNKAMYFPTILIAWTKSILTMSERGLLSWYIISIGIGATIILGILIFA